MSASKQGTPEQAKRVWNEWVKRQKMPGTCRFTAERVDLIRKRIGLGYSDDDLIAVVRWAYESPDLGPRFLRGENEQRRTYLDLDSLLRIAKLGARVQAALTWIQEMERPAAGNGESAHPSGLRVVRGGRSVRR